MKVLLSLVAVVLTAGLAASAYAGVTGLDTKPVTSMARPERPQWRAINLPAGRELTFASTTPGRTGLTFACRSGDPRIEIRAPMANTATTPAVRLVSGGFVRVYFSRPEFEDGREGIVVARASAKDELIDSFRHSGRIMSGRVAMVAQSVAEKEAIKGFFAGCAGQSQAGLSEQGSP
jgi:hypothetical protein